MQNTLSIVSKPAHPDLQIASRILQTNGFIPARQLAEGQALEFKGSATQKQLAKYFAPLAIDWCLHKEPVNVHSVLLCDMDSTIIQEECVDELADLAGIGAQVKNITRAAMNGEIDFEQALRRRVALLSGQSSTCLETCWKERINISQGAKTLIATMNEMGAITALVSGGFTWFTKRVGEQVGFLETHANQLQIKDGQLTGCVQGAIVGANTKLQHLERLRAAGGTVCAIGDGANDAPMIAAANMGIAYHAKPILADHANGQIRHTDLSTALFFQGINKEKWVMRD